MRTSPRRPLILKRRRLPLPVQNAPSETSEEEAKRSPAQPEPAPAQASQEVAESSSCKFPAGIKIINHPTTPNTQVVAIPSNADIQSIITALTACSQASWSPSKAKTGELCWFILISSGGPSSHPSQPQAHSSRDPKKSYCGLKSPTRCVSEMLVTKRREKREVSRSRRKQHLQPPCLDEPDLFFSEDSSTFRPAVELLAESSEPAPHLSCPQEEGGPFKTPIKETLPVSSTPSKSVLSRDPESWRLTPPAKVGGLDFSPVRTPQGAFGLLPDSLGLMELNTTPLKSGPLFDSPRELLNSEPFDLASDPFGSPPPPHVEGPKPGSPELQIPSLSANRSLTEGLVLDTMNDSLSKILLDISFPGLEEDPLGPDNINWSQFIP